MVDERQEARKPVWLLVIGATLLLILLPAQVEHDRFSLCRESLLDLATFLAPRHFRHFWNGGRHGVTVRADGQILAEEDVLHFDAVRLAKGAFEQRLGD